MENLVNLTQTIGSGIATFMKRAETIFKDADEAIAVVKAMAPEVRALAVTIFADVMSLVADAEGAVAAQGLNFVLDEKALADIKKLIADAAAGEKQAVATFTALGLKLPAKL